MSLKVKDVKKIIEDFAPLKLQEKYDNSGFAVGSIDSEITSILIGLDCTLEVIDEAINKGCNTIITHHPLLFHKPESVTDETLLGKKLIKLIKNDLNLYSSHTNLDAVKGGINDILMTILGFDNYDSICTIEPIENLQFSEACNEGSGIGRIIKFNEAITLGELCNKVKKTLNINILRFCGDNTKLINKVAVISGSGQDYFKAACSLGADCIITGDTTYHYISDYNELGLAIIDAGHFETEWISFTIFAEKLKKLLNDQGFNNSVLISENTITPFKYI